MHLTVGIILWTIAYFKGNIRNWKDYHSTILYVTLLVFLYEYICKDYFLWKNEGIIIKDHFYIELIHGFLVLPAITLLYLDNYDKTKKGKLFYILIWSFLSGIIELLVFIRTGYITFHNGYKYWMEFPFYLTMYTMIRLHHRSPLVAYFFSIIIIVFLIWYFEVPIPSK